MVVFSTLNEINKQEFQRKNMKKLQEIPKHAISKLWFSKQNNLSKKQTLKI